MPNYKEHIWEMCVLKIGLFAFITLSLELLNFIFRIL
jgi:hypothetical protein